MCIIIVKKKGVELPKKEVFRDSFSNNPDGCGFMYVENGKVQVRKGFMGYKNMYKQAKQINDRLGDINMMFHFRIGTSGRNDQKTTHPYPISNVKQDLQKLKIETDIAMMHNGIISNMTDKEHPDLNDTQIFIRDILSVFKELNERFYEIPSCVKMIEDYIGASKLAFLTDKDEVVLIGNFIENEGILYSNGTYKKYTYSYANYGYNWDKWDKDDFIYNYNNTTYGKDEKSKLLDYKDDYDEIDYDNYIELEEGMSVEYRSGNIVKVGSKTDWGYDGFGNLVKMYQGYPTSIIARDVRVYNQQDEEIWAF